MSFSFYRADAQYCDFLRKSDPCVPYTMDRKETRPFVGIVFSINGYNYYAPLTSPKPKHITMKNQIDFLKINGGTWGAINLNNMIPIHTDSLKPVDMKILPTDDKATIDYKNLLTNQLSWCNTTENVAFITGKAQKLYRAIIEKTARPQLVERCCNFPIDEQQYLVYCQSHNLSIEKKTELAEKHPAPDQTAKVSMKDRFAAAQAEADRRVAGQAAPAPQKSKDDPER
jgi:protein AbiQ